MPILSPATSRTASPLPPQAALPELGVGRPSAIQITALPAVLTGGNCAVQSYTGSGKVRLRASALRPTRALGE